MYAPFLYCHSTLQQGPQTVFSPLLLFLQKVFMYIRKNFKTQSS